MRTQTREVIKKEEVTIYIADDGKEFNNEEDCIKWEESYEYVIKKSFDKIPQIKVPYGEESYVGGNLDDYIIIAKPRTVEDIVILEAYIKNQIREKIDLTHEYIGKEIVVNFGYDCDYVEVDILDDKLNNIQKFYQSVKEQFAGEENK